MKRFFFLVACLALLAVGTVEAQVLKFKAESSFGKAFDFDSNTWGEWTETTASKALFVIDEEERTIRIFGINETKELDIYDVDSMGIDEDGDYYWVFSCIDEDGEEMEVVYFLITDLERPDQIYIIYPYFRVGFNGYIKD